MTTENRSPEKAVVKTRGRLYLGLGRYIIPVPPCLMRMGAAGSARQADRTLARLSRSITSSGISSSPRSPKGGLALRGLHSRAAGPFPDRVRAIVDQLERKMIFLFRNQRGEVTWAYPVTAEPTPHHVTFTTGQQIYAA